MKFTPCNDDMHPTATEKLAIYLTLNSGVMYSAARAVNTQYNILRTCCALSPQLTLTCSFYQVPAVLYLPAGCPM